MSSWLDENKTWLVGLGIPGVLSAAFRILWGRLVTKQDLEIQELKAELKASTKELWKVHRELDWLRGKYGEKPANSSSQPPSSR